MDYEFFMRKALKQAEKALSAGEFPVGCVITHQGKILATASRTGTIGNYPNEIDHAEMIALRDLSGLELNTDKDKVTLFTTLEPCLMCLGALILGGVDQIVFAYEDIMGGGTGCDLAKLPSLYKNQNMLIVPHILRTKSLELFKSFFQNPKHSYWRGSLLATYTLSQ